MAPCQKIAQEKKAHKRQWETFFLLPLLIAIILFTNLAFSLSSFASSLPLLRSLFFFGIVNINLILLATLIFLISKNLSKLFFERKAIGSKLKVKLVIAFLSLSIIPIIVLFVISSLYINSAFDKWFSLRVKNALQASMEISHAYYKDHQKKARHFAQKIRKEISKDYQKLAPFDFESSLFTLKEKLEKQRMNYSLSALELYSGHLSSRSIVFAKELQEDFFPRLPISSIQKALLGNTVSIVQQVEMGDILRTTIPIYSSKAKGKESPLSAVGVLAVNYFIPTSIVEKTTSVSSAIKDYGIVNPLEYPIKSSYFAILIFITLLIIFVAIWAGLYLARQLTGPLEELEKAAKKVGSGDLNVELHNTGNDEISTVVTAFNKMTVDLKNNRNQLEFINKKLDEKRTYVELVLSNVSAGILSIDANGKITTMNESAGDLLGISSLNCIGKSAIDIFSKYIPGLNQIIQKSMLESNKKSIKETLRLLSKNEEIINILITVTAHHNKYKVYQGLVLVIDDITHIAKHQREAAWREIAKRIAHEIKNPLTPIKLSAQRLKKRISGFTGKEEQKILEECTETIVRQVDELKKMVNEFSEYARLPEANPSFSDINEAIKEIVYLYQQGHKDTEFHFIEDSYIQKFFFDREQVKRVIINLLTNAIAALRETNRKVRKNVSISTHLDIKKNMVRVEILDNGSGISRQIMPLLFEPHFSTRKEGTGLGLAIAKKIITDHSGHIRVSSQSDTSEGKVQGTCFTIELPIRNKESNKREINHGL